MTEALISDLARIKALRVISRTSAMTYKGVREVAARDRARAERRRGARGLGAARRQPRARHRAARLGARRRDAVGRPLRPRARRTCSSLQSERRRDGGARRSRSRLTPARGDAARAARRGQPRGACRVPEGPARLLAASPEAVDLALRHARRALELDPTSRRRGRRSPTATSFARVRGMAHSGRGGGRGDARRPARARARPVARRRARVARHRSCRTRGDVARRAPRRSSARSSSIPGLAFAHNMLGARALLRSSVTTRRWPPTDRIGAVSTRSR